MAEVNANASVTVDEVREIYVTDLTDPQLANFINMAYQIVNQLGITTNVAMLELLLSAHFATMFDGVAKSESVAGEWSITYAFQGGEGLMSSPYGQQALALDSTGLLRKQGLKRAAISVTSEYDTHGSTYLQGLTSDG